MSSKSSYEFRPFGCRLVCRTAQLLFHGIVAAALPAHAATTLNVGTTAMTIAVDGACSLPEALQAARTNATANECVVSGGAPFTINLQAGADYNATTVGHSDGFLGNSAFLVNGGNTIAINGNGSQIRQTGQAMRIFNVSGGAHLIIRNATVSGGNAFEATFSSGAGFGGGLYVDGGTVSLEDVNFVGHFSSISGSAFYANGASTVNLHRVTITATSSNSTGELMSVRNGATLNMANSTVDGRGTSPANAILILDGSTANISGSTIAESFSLGNRASTVRVSTSIVSGGCGANGGGTFSFSRVASSSGTCSPVTVEPSLRALANNGGSTLTILPIIPAGIQDASPGCTYLSSGTNPLFTDGAAMTTDQRGFPRDANCDIGAVESMTISPPSLPGGTFGVPYNATISGPPVTFAITSGALPPGLSLDAGTGDISGTPSAGGISFFNVTVTDSGGFKSEIRYTLPIARANQTLTFNSQTPSLQFFAPGASFPISPLATASSMLTPSYTSDSPGVCTVSGTTVTMVSGGLCVIRAQQNGNSNYNPATAVTQTVTINPGPQTLTFGAQSAQTFVAGGTFAINPVAATNAGAPGVEHSSLTPAVCTVTGTTVTMVAAGTCTLRASHVGNSNYQPAVSGNQDVIINPGVQVILFTAPTARALGEAPFSVTATGGASGNPVTFTSLTPVVCTATGINGSLVTLLLAGTCTLRAAQAGNANYVAAATVDRSFMVGSGTSTVGIDSSLNPAPYRSPVTLTARIGGVAPGGTVRVLNGAATLCEAPVSNGIATCTVRDLLEGAHSLRAYYLGDANNQPAFSAEFIQIVPKVGIHQGAWWGGPQENGWGLSIMEQGDTLVAGWYYFDAAGKPTWLIVPGCNWNANKTACTGSLQRATSSWFGNYRADDVRQIPVGSATFTFTDGGNGRFDYTVDGSAGSKAISRMDLGPNPSAPFDFTNVWWGGQSQNGWGLSLFAAGPTLAGVWYTYDAQGQPTWMLFNGGSWVNPSTYRSALFRATGAPMIGATYDARRFNAQPVGELYFQFADFNAGEMTYIVDGLLQFKRISKQKF